MTSLTPATEAELAEAVAESAAAARPLELIGRGTKRHLGRPLQTEATLDLSRFAGVVAYEPEELILTARPGTPLAEIESLLAGRGQQLAFEPCDLGPLLGQPAAAGSLGGVIACNLAGPRRFKAGAARDHLLGLAGVTGDGARFKAGGKVVKNVTGYDLCKLVAGSWGTLVAMTEVTVKVLPAPEQTRTLLLFGHSAAQATRAMAAALGSACEVSGAAWLPPGLAARSGIDLVAGPGRSVTALRLEGPAPSVAARLAALRALVGPGVAQEELHGQRSGRLWRAVRDGQPFVGDPRNLWRLSLTPSAAPDLLALVGAGPEDALLDWGGGLVWLAADPAADLSLTLSTALSKLGGQATLIRAPAARRAAAAALTAEAPALVALARRVKASFDPRGIFNPGRLYAGV
jgi:glycolate oxidase FAD binding subunit